MNTYRIKDPTSGKIVSLTGDSSPTEQELTDIFAKLNTETKAPEVPAPIPPVEGSSIKQTISNVARPVFEVGGAMGGGAIGLGVGGPAAALTATAGGALGYAGGKSTADALDEFLGIKQVPKDLKEVGKRTVSNIYEGAKFEAMGQAMAPVVKGLMAGGGYLGKKLGSAVFGVSDEALNAYLANPSLIKDTSMEKLAQSLPKVAEKFQGIISYFSKDANKLLSKSKFLEPSATDAGGAITKTEVDSVVKSVRRTLGGIYGPDAKAAAKTIINWTEDLKKLGPTVSQNQIRGIVDKLDNEIPWNKFWHDPSSLTKSESALIDMRGGLNDLIKVKNPNYAEAMKPVEQAITTQKEFVRQFGIHRVQGEGFVPKDMTTSRLSSALKEGKLETQRIAGGVKKITGEDILGQVQNAKYNQEFFSPREVRPMTLDLLTILSAAGGGALGGGVGGGAGALVGRVAGNAAGKYSGVAGAKILDLISQMPSIGITKALSNPLLRSILAQRGVKATGNSDTQVQNLLDLIGNRGTR